MTESCEFGVVFDMDGVLIDSADAHYRSWRDLGAEHNLTITRRQFDESFGRHNADIVPAFFGPVDAARLAALADRKEAIYRDIIRSAPPLVEGAAELIRALHQRGAAVGIGSSGPLANIRLVLDALGVASIIRAIVSAEDVTRGKPDPQVFTAACDRLGLPPSRCVVIEDAPAGVASGKAAGASVVGVLLYHPAERLAAADRIVARLADLTARECEKLARGRDTDTPSAL
jgi:HAD superfamily hydrolase (TIGR01509 family)